MLRLLFHVDAMTWYQLLLEYHIAASKFFGFFAHLSGPQSALAGITEEHKPFLCVLVGLRTEFCSHLDHWKL